ncbi:NAD-dependent succinate-semialdehyde dehydrogenase [Swaminathania salitolerans]|uniref:Succinate semialdehyde dehydrogenase [NAD(P)+] Sad n=1 Tax=Swaminathania salitolerans TaxID=182838 RepID=A0A511BLW7_9PROT|nr:NAD-dependent succinate-semialdehyde dehydrogenase [Swaminathania salitolerans]GBQ10548.1 NAD-dependent aldehyde dehydrogenase [Swaminathania salitolerans LMG 21291]GEL01329.1 succinate semialdehyde dehydrogenase [NAD(P)+] Sad [Swaminathania salitolerans]
MSEEETRTGVTTVDPSTGETLSSYAFLADDALEGVLARAGSGFRSWRALSPGKRVEALRRMGQALDTHRDALALQATREMGKPIATARAEIDKCVAVIDWYADRALTLLQDRAMTPPSGDACLSYAPTGTVLAVMPWNFPFWQILRAAVPILLGGNGFLVKPAENTLGCGMSLHELAEQSGLVPAFQSVNLSREQVARVIADPRISGVTVTGSVRVGRILAGLAGQHGKKSVLELGGSDPFVVLADADLDLAVESAVAARFANCGQVCISAKRIILDAAIAPAFTEAFVERVRAIEPATPCEDDAFLGPMARLDLRDTLHAQVERSIAEGARCVLGGKTIARPGAWYEPTVLCDVTPEMTAFREELFGPVACLTVARDTGHALALANDTEYGLGASVWTRDTALGHTLARQIDAGTVSINRITASDPALPIGGTRASGFGRELTELGLHEFMNIKTIWSR